MTGSTIIRARGAEPGDSKFISFDLCIDSFSCFSAAFDISTNLTLSLLLILAGCFYSAVQLVDNWTLIAPAPLLRRFQCPRELCLLA